MKFMAIISSVLAAVASVVANLGSNACLVLMIDEPECPKNLIK